ncbi:hypothetical protein A0H81_09914 [Grifola frondosa]|uniref:Uncharacterized protein n=1 Tax=Grifola frondosa TaxID=5627 RepID=A0A1C7M106_GRIFR|nr:hypothetical protein A0H81_09914 [Grifola frondosa]
MSALSNDLPMDVDQSDAMEWTPAQPSEITVDSHSVPSRLNAMAIQNPAHVTRSFQLETPSRGNSPANENTVDAPRSFNLETPSRGNTPPQHSGKHRPNARHSVIQSGDTVTGNTPEPIHGLQPVLTFALETPSRVGKQNTWLIESPDIRPDSPVQFNSPAPAGDVDQIGSTTSPHQWGTPMSQPPKANVEVPRTQSRAPSTVPLATGDTAGNALPPLQWGQLPLPQAVFPPSVPVVPICHHW